MHKKKKKKKRKKKIKIINNEDQLCAILSSFPSFFLSALVKTSFFDSYFYRRAMLNEAVELNIRWEKATRWNLSKDRHEWKVRLGERNCLKKPLKETFCVERKVEWRKFRISKIMKNIFNYFFKGAAISAWTRQAATQNWICLWAEWWAGRIVRAQARAHITTWPQTCSTTYCSNKASQIIN